MCVCGLILALLVWEGKKARVGQEVLHTRATPPERVSNLVPRPHLPKVSLFQGGGGGGQGMRLGSTETVCVSVLSSSK